MKTWVLLLLGCMLAATSHAQARRVVYEWTDANGVRHFSDQPQPGAREITLSGSPPSSTAPQAAAAARSTPRATPAAPVQYTRLELISPDNDASFFTPDEEIVVRVRPEPEIAAGDRLVTYLDGRQLGDVNQLEHRFSNLPRGAHTLQSAIFARDGAERIRSEKITFHMKQTTVNNPRNQGPALRPPPRPQPR
jgi:hypothetical protein